MKTLSDILFRWPLMVLLVVLAFAMPALADETLKAEALLIWGTNDPLPSDTKLTPVDASLAGKLVKSPYRWKYYYEVSRKPLNIAPGATQKEVTLSKHCSLEVSNLGNSRMEVKLFGKGKLVSTQKEPLVDKCLLIIGGGSENDTAWFVIIRKPVDVKAATPVAAPVVPAVPSK